MLTAAGRRSTIGQAVKVGNQDIDNVHIGQNAEVQLNAYNQRTTPLVEGVVAYVAGDAQERSADAGNPLFVNHIQLDQAQLALMADVALSPGMPVTAFIKIGRKPSWIICSPLTEHWRQKLSRGVKWP
ncbi:MAG: HlyD family secretion protein [Candidatus Competibacteraceae bacterium]|nr:HlyD family secretion protein [Candidatus Competibacteraceae bacterium]